MNRMRAGLPAGVAVFLALATVEALALTTGIVPARKLYGIPIVVVALLVSLIVAYVRGRQKALSLVVCSELDSESKYFCRRCSEANLREATGIVQPIFGRDSIDAAVVEQWRLGNPQGFMEIVNEENVLVGCFVVVGLESSLMRQFKEGTVAESAILGRHVLPMSRTKRLTDIYISGVMVRDSSDYLGAKRTRVLIWCMLKYLKHHFGVSSKKKLYALALNRESERMLKSLKFRVYSKSSSRVDKHNLYMIDYTKDQWEEVSRRLGDLSAMCKISF